MESYIDTYFDVTTTRFNSQTYREMCDFKERIGYQGSLYNTPVRMSEEVNPQKYLIVLEMNNTINKIMGVGLIKNKVFHDKKFKDIYYDEQLNRHTYRSKFHVKIFETSDEGPNSLLEDWEHEFVQDELEKRMFYGKGHMKRGHCFTRIPRKWLTTRHKVFLVDILRKYCPKVEKILPC